MDKIKSLLLPLALVFASLAVFEFGARYGATNMRAFAIASEIQFPLSVYEQSSSKMDASSKETFALVIDNGIAAGSMHRKIWYLNKKAKASLDKALAYALSVRGNATAERYESMENRDDLPEVNQAKLTEIIASLKEAKLELVDNAPPAADTVGEEGETKTE